MSHENVIIFKKELRPYQCIVFKKKNVSPCPHEELPSLFRAVYEDFLILYYMIFLLTINFLVTKKNTTTKCDPIIFKTQIGMAILK